MEPAPEPEMGVEAWKAQQVFRKLFEHTVKEKVKLIDVFYRADSDGSRSMDRVEVCT